MVSGKGPEIERGNAGPGFGPIPDPMVTEAHLRATQGKLTQPDASVMPEEAPTDSHLEHVGTPLDKTYRHLRLLGVEDEYGLVEDE